MARDCLECGGPIARTAGVKKEFCCAACRKSFGNRRAMRGALIYDLFMATRYEREKAAKLDLWTMLCRAGLQFRQEDDRRRNGRRSWRAPEEVVQENLPLTAEILTKPHRVGRGGLGQPASRGA